MTAAPLCTAHVAAGRDYWTSSDPAEREAARWICRTGASGRPCPLFAFCANRTPADDDVTVRAGVDADERRGPVMVNPPARLRARVRGLADHGHRSRYVSGCRCVPCTAANTAYQANHRREPVVTAAPTLVVVDQLNLFGATA